MSIERKTIWKVVENSLCTGCGTCVGICPLDAIEMEIEHKKGIYIPQLDEEECNQCGLCFDVCPGHSVDFRKLNQEIFGKEPEDVLLGNYINCYAGHATDYDIRYNSASGGLVTALLIYALEQGMIDGALVTRMKKDNPLEPEPFIARTKDEIIEAAKSKYCPVPANIDLREILHTEGKYAVVGLPCHIQGVRKAELINKKLKQRIVLHFGLLCSSNRTFLATEYMLRKAGINPQEVARFDYRGQGNLGQFVATLRNGKRYSLPFLEYYVKLLRSFFIPTRCTLCSDHSCELADISFGDIGFPEFQHDSIGISSIISRSEVGDRFLKQATSAGIIELSNISRDRLVESKIGAFHRKKKHLTGRRNLFGLQGKPVPNDTTKLLKSNLLSYIYAMVLYPEIYISRRRRLWGLIGSLSVLLRWGSRVLAREK
jgi:coenzyme F420 hydrogenase subunit beta